MTDKDLRISIKDNHSYQTFYIKDIYAFFDKVQQDPNIAIKYKSMDIDSFMTWAKNDLTPKQFYKLQLINESLILEQ
jgi:hypothetical protein